MPKRKFEDEEERNMDPMDIHRAAKEGDLYRVRQLVEADASSFYSRDDKGGTPILVAAFYGHHAVVEFLINFILCPGNRKPPMENEDALCPFLLLDNSTLLHFVSKKGWADIAQILIEEGLNTVNAAAADGCTPLLAAALRGREEVAALLLRSGADVNRRGALGMTALHWAVHGRHVTLVKLLLEEEGLDLNPQDDLGDTPLHFACHRGSRVRREVLKLLLAADADANSVNGLGETPLSIYLRKSNPSLEVINLFVQHGAFFQDPAYGEISGNPVLRENVLKNVDLCTQSVINKFTHQTLPALYSNPYFASMLPSMYNFILNASQTEEVENFVRREIQQNTFCNVVRVRPTALSALCVQCLAAYTARLEHTPA